jgi:DNA-binding IclR family transcriptional regulator
MVPLGHRSARVLEAIAAQPGSTNRELADAAGISDEGQASKILARLQTLGLIDHRPEWRVGEPHAWRLTARGEQRERTKVAEGRASRELR